MEVSTVEFLPYFVDIYMKENKINRFTPYDIAIQIFVRSVLE